MDQLLLGIDGIICLLDDILVTGKNYQDHMRNLELVLQKLQDAEFTIKRSKCKFLQDSVCYLGFKIDKDGVHKNPKKVQGMLVSPRPTNVDKVRPFVGYLISTENLLIILLK